MIMFLIYCPDVCVCICLWGMKQQQQNQNQQQQQQHHRLGGRSETGLEELIMGCTSSNDIKEVTVHQLFDPEFYIYDYTTV